MWPLGDQSDRESHWWAHFWAKPQAVEWERLGLVAEVALYVRRFAEAEERGSSVAAGTLVKQLGEQLGLTIPGMRMHRWRIAGAAGASPETKTTTGRSRRTAESSARDRMKVIDGGAA
jgi:hypothetical protein